MSKALASAHTVSSHVGKFSVTCEQEVYYDNQPVVGQIILKLQGPFHCKTLSVALTCDLDCVEDAGGRGNVPLYYGDEMVWEGNGLPAGEHHIDFEIDMPYGLPASITWPTPGYGDNQVRWHVVAMATTTAEGMPVLVRLCSVIFRKATVFRPTPLKSPQVRRGKPFFLSPQSHQLYLSAELTHDVYTRGEIIEVTYRIHNESSRTVNEVTVLAIQRIKLSCDGVAPKETTVILDQGDYTNGCPLTKNQVVANTVRLRLTSDQEDSVRAVGPGSQATGEDCEHINNRLASTVHYHEPPLPSVQHPTVLEVSYEVVVRCFLWGGTQHEVTVPFCLSDNVHSPKDFREEWVHPLTPTEHSANRGTSPYSFKTVAHRSPVTSLLSLEDAQAHIQSGRSNNSLHHNNST
eukprot:comp7107_c0_seq1/m.2837 comp7107_c0_seq1/g.2837  ORF comp7107_c0_seq1/g.2837 comp7107_c0_seq1/m.2837 type:complete len:405 (-) comp7107_c0_seq1:450-1664(-)